MMAPYDLSVVLVSWNVRDALLRCLAALPAALDDVRAQIIVVDNASHDGTVAAVRAQFPRVQVLALERNLLYTAAANLGLQEARGRHWLLLNPDTLPHAHSLARLCRYAEAHPRAGLLGPRILDARGEDDLLTARHLPTLWSELADWSGLSRRFSRHRWLAANLRPAFDRSQISSVPLLSGACLLLSGHLPPTLRGLDPFFPMYGEDVDLCRRVQEAGFRTVLVGKAVITHWGGESSRQQPVWTTVLAVDGANRYLRRWHGSGTAGAHRLGMAAIALLKFLYYHFSSMFIPDAILRRRAYRALLWWALSGRIPNPGT